MKNYMKRDKFFYASPALFPKWPYKSRLAIGVRLADFRARNKKIFNFLIKGNKKIFNFLIKGKMYSINRTMAFKYGLKYMMPYGKLPNIIPLEEFTMTDLTQQVRKDTQQLSFV